jgi:hypothetical protein
MLTSKNDAIEMTASGYAHDLLEISTHITPFFPGAEIHMAKPNYAFEKRQKELAKKQKKQEKLDQRKAGGGHDADMEPETQAEVDDTPVPPPAAD